jgi:hypothetical protein
MNKVPVLPDPIISYIHKHRIESYFSINSCGLNTPQIYLGTSRCLEKQLNPSIYPLILKPLMSSGSKGIKLIKKASNFTENENKVLYLEKYIEGTHYLAYFIGKDICVGEKQPLANEHSEIKHIKPEKDMTDAIKIWRDKYNLLFGHLDMIREKSSGNLIVVDPGTFPEFSNWKLGEDLAHSICSLLLDRYKDMRESN